MNIAKKILISILIVINASNYSFAEEKNKVAKEITPREVISRKENNSQDTFSKGIRAINVLISERNRLVSIIVDVMKDLNQMEEQLKQSGTDLSEKERATLELGITKLKAEQEKMKSLISGIDSYLLLKKQQADGKSAIAATDAISEEDKLLLAQFAAANQLPYHYVETNRPAWKTALYLGLGVAGTAAFIYAIYKFVHLNNDLATSNGNLNELKTTLATMQTNFAERVDNLGVVLNQRDNEINALRNDLNNFRNNQNNNNNNNDNRFGKFEILLKNQNQKLNIDEVLKRTDLKLEQFEREKIKTLEKTFNDFFNEKIIEDKKINNEKVSVLENTIKELETTIKNISLNINNKFMTDEKDIKGCTEKIKQLENLTTDVLSGQIDDVEKANKEETDKLNKLVLQLDKKFVDYMNTSAENNKQLLSDMNTTIDTVKKENSLSNTNLSNKITDSEKTLNTLKTSLENIDKKYKVLEDQIKKVSEDLFKQLDLNKNEEENHYKLLNTSIKKLADKLNAITRALKIGKLKDAKQKLFDLEKEVTDVNNLCKKLKNQNSALRKQNLEQLKKLNLHFLMYVVEKLDPSKKYKEKYYSQKQEEFNNTKDKESLKNIFKAMISDMHNDFGNLVTKETISNNLGNKSKTIEKLNKDILDKKTDSPKIKNTVKNVYADIKNLGHIRVEQTVGINTGINPKQPSANLANAYGVDKIPVNKKDLNFPKKINN